MTQYNPNSLNSFVDELIKNKNLGELDFEVVQQIKTDLLDRIEDRINATILANMPPEKLEYFEKLLDQSTAEEIQAFCQRNIMDLDQILAKELVDFRETYLNS